MGLYIHGTGPIRGNQHNRVAIQVTLAEAGTMTHNMALNLAPFGRWTLRDKAAQRRLALR